MVYRVRPSELDCDGYSCVKRECTSYMNVLNVRTGKIVLWRITHAASNVEATRGMGRR